MGKIPCAFERNRIGSIGIGLYAYNERERQVQRFLEMKREYEKRHTYRDYDKDKAKAYIDLENVRKYGIEHIEAENELFAWYFDGIADKLDEMITDRAREVIKRNIEHYISKQNKQRTRIMKGSTLTYPLMIKIEDMLDIASGHRDFCRLTASKGVLYSPFRVNYRYHLNPQRTRMGDMYYLTIAICLSWMLRNRKALGVPPLSHVKICLDEEWKKSHDREFIIRSMKLWGLKPSDYHTPYTDDYFFYDYLRGKRGHYHMGDNGCYVESPHNKYKFDISMSDSTVGYVCRDYKKNNYCFFSRLSFDIDTGASGDPLTWGWNPNHQFKMERCSIDNIIGRKNNSIWVPIIVEESSTFLGAWYNPVFGYESTNGIRLTRDAAKDMIPYTFRMGENVIDWGVQSSVDKLTFLQTLAAIGITDISLLKFYEWAYRHASAKGISETHHEIEDYSLMGAMKEMILKLDAVDDFYGLFSDVDIEYLASPMTITDTDVTAARQYLIMDDF